MQFIIFTNFLLLFFLSSSWCAVNTDRRELAWFLQISDLHLSDFHLKRGSDLVSFLSEIVPFWNVSSIVITGDITDSKASSRRSEQRIGEWQQYENVLQIARDTLEASEANYIDIRGNHDAFDVPVRNKERDYFLHHSMQGLNWFNNRVLIHPLPVTRNASCPVYVLVGVDAAPQVGLRSPTNFLGRITGDILTELESKLVDEIRHWSIRDCDPVYLAYGHYPLSMIAKDSSSPVAGDQGELKRLLLKYGVKTWLFGHLHDEVGNHLSRIHHGSAATLLELELADWKFIRRFRIIAIDHGEFSFVDLEAKSTKETSLMEFDPVEDSVVVNGFIVLITWPPSSYLAPLGTPRRQRVSWWNEIRALVLPVSPLASSHQSRVINVSAEITCGSKSTPLRTLDLNQTTDQRLVYSIGVPDGFRGLDCDEIYVQVFAQGSNKGNRASSERRLLEQKESAREYPHSWMESIILKTDWYWFLQNFYFTVILAHIVLLLFIPKFCHLMGYFQSPMTSSNLDNQTTNGHKKNKWKLVFLCPIYAFVETAGDICLFWSQFVYLLVIWFGPWGVARVLSNRPMGFLFIPTVFVKSESASSSDYGSVFTPEMPMRSIMFYFFVVLPSILWSVWTMRYLKLKSNGEILTKHRILILLHIMIGLFPIAAFAMTLFYSWRYYGPLSVLLSPAFVGWIILIAISIVSMIKQVKKCRTD
eukprot:g5401.t1